MKEEPIPADILLIKSSFPTGMCFVDTMNLDGETNLKDKMTPKVTNELNEKDLLALQGYMLCEKPNEVLEKWEANLNIEGYGKPIVCNFKQLLLKGCTLKNTGFVYGIVVYTGHSTKIMKNAKYPPIKVSNVMRVMNMLLYSIFGFLFLIAIFFALAYILWQRNKGVSYSYLQLYNSKGVLVSPGVSVTDFFIKFLTFIVSYAHLVPISLYVALEFVKMIQSILISKDIEMFDSTVGKAATARTIDLIEELGQVEFVFSDKTGTLTKNEMEFRKCTVNNKVFGDLPHSDSKKKYTINGDYRAYDILNSSSQSEDKVKLNEFFTCIAVCHSAYVEEKDKGELIYQSSSPDEIALLLGASQMGFTFSKRSTSSIEILNFNNKPKMFDLILEIPFDSDRKRMSVIVRPRKGKDDEYYVYTKGADAKMMDIMLLTSGMKHGINDHLDTFAKEGLRTLVMAKKIIDKEQAMTFKSEFERISMSTDESKEKEFSDLFGEIERDLGYVGCSAIEDKLQDVII
jgi:phospholipid-transporting ATPase